MVRIFKHYVPGSLLFLGLVEHLFLITALYAALFLRWANVEDFTGSLSEHLPEAVVFASVVTLTMIALGLYHKEQCRNLGMTFLRLLLSFLFAFVALTFLFYLYPDLAIWRSAFAIAVVAGIAGIMALRAAFVHLADMQAFKRRILVLGAGPRAARVENLEGDDQTRSFTCVGFVPFNDAEVRVADGRVIRGNRGLTELVRAQDIEEIVVAVEERRGSTPVDSLLECKLAGVAITDYSTFWERETGKVDLDTLHPSWLIFSDGFVGGWLQATVKRAFDIAASLVLLGFTMPLMVLAALAVTMESPGGMFYRQERLGLNGTPFMLLKFRSMRSDAEKDGVPRWAAVNDSRVTRVGNFIRRTRIDELPQVFNVLRGDMSFIGPRPERPFFVGELRQVIPYYFERHRVKPGISGWAQINYPYGASIEDAKEKFQYDLYYIKNYSLFLDFSIMLQTVRVVFWPQGVR